MSLFFPSASPKILSPFFLLPHNKSHPINLFSLWPTKNLTLFFSFLISMFLVFFWIFCLCPSERLLSVWFSKPRRKFYCKVSPRFAALSVFPSPFFLHFLISELVISRPVSIRCCPLSYLLFSTTAKWPYVRSSRCCISLSSLFFSFSLIFSLIFSQSALFCHHRDFDSSLSLLCMRVFARVCACVRLCVCVYVSASVFLLSLLILPPVRRRWD